MSKLKYHIEQCDNGIVLVDNTDTEITTAEVVLDDDIVSTLGKMLWAEVQHILDAELKNAAEIEITITAKDSKL